jgi:hypothetical protein
VKYLLESDFMKISKLILVLGSAVACTSYLTCGVLEDPKDQLFEKLHQIDYAGAQECIKNGADVNVLMSNSGWTFEQQYRFIHFFTSNPMPRARAIKFLVKNGADLKLKTKDGKTAHQIATEALLEILENIQMVWSGQYVNAVLAGQIVFKLRVMSFLLLTSFEDGSGLLNKEQFIKNLENLKQGWNVASTILKEVINKDFVSRKEQNFIYDIIMNLRNCLKNASDKKCFESLFMVLVLFNRIDGSMLNKEQRQEHFAYWDEYFSNLSIDS